MGKYAWIVGAAVIAVALIVAAGLYAAGAGGSRAHASGIEPRSALGDYGWEELSAISGEMAACGDKSAAIAVAARYGLCGADGSLDGAQAKEVALSDGRIVHAMLAGVFHDERADGGRAGLTFVFADAAAEHAMNHGFEDAAGDAPDSVGGWSASDMRAWLNGDFLDELPEDLRGCIVPAAKATASRVGSAYELDEAGHLAGARADWVDTTADKLWLLSASEVCGIVPERADLGIDDTMAAIYSGEGTQYRLFADAGTEAFKANDALVRHLAGDGESADKPCTWWLRTKTLEFGDGFWLVGTDGAPLNGIGEDARAAVDPEFAPDRSGAPITPEA